MRTIGSRELKTRLGAVLRDVRERGEEYVVTQHGKAVARLVPEPAPEAKKLDMRAWLEEGDRIAEEIGRHWPEGLSAVDALREDRDRLLDPKRVG